MDDSANGDKKPAAIDTSGGGAVINKTLHNDDNDTYSDSNDGGNDEHDNDNDDDDVYYDAEENIDDVSGYGGDDDIDKVGAQFMSQFGIKNEHDYVMKLVTSFLNNMGLTGGYDTGSVDFAESDENIDGFMNEVKNNPLPFDLLYTHIIRELTNLLNEGGEYIVHHLPPSELDSLEELSPLNDDDYNDYDATKVWASEDSYKVDLPIFIKKLEENKNDLQNASRVDFIRLIQRIVNDVINEGGGYKVKRCPPTMREWQRVAPTYNVVQVLADDEKMSPNPPPNRYFYYQGLVYFLSIHVPNEVINLLTEHQLLEIYLFGVKVGESSMDLWVWWPYISIILSFHPKLRVNWVCIAVPLGMNSWIIEQYIHFMHPLLHLNGEWFHRSILNFVPR